MSMRDPCLIIITDEKNSDEKKNDYQTIIDIIEKNPKTLIHEYIKDWYQLHKTGTQNEFPPGTSTNYKINDLKDYLLQKFPDEEELINDKIEEYKYSIGYGDDVFTYGGKKRKTKKNRKSIKIRRSKKNIKMRKSKKNIIMRKGKKSMKTRKIY